MLQVIAVYKGNLDKLMEDVFKYEKIIEGWKVRYPGREADLNIEIDGGEFYTLVLKCRKQ